MVQVLVCGAGKIGRFVAVLLARSGDYQVKLVDANQPDVALNALLSQYPAIEFQQLSVTDAAALMELCRKNEFNALISCLHSALNIPLAKIALEFKLHYFNLSEDRKTKAQILELAQQAQTAFVPQCGIAPGLVDIKAHHLMQQFDELTSATLSVGALPQQVSNSIHYQLSWSIDGLVNEYLNSCRVIEAGQDKEVPPLSELDILNHEGATFEMFNTSGGLGTLGDYYRDKIQYMHYKTIRYPGHVAAMRTLFKEHNFNHQSLVDWYRKHIPFTAQDMVVMYISVTGKMNGEFAERNYFHKWYARPLDGNCWTAIQWTTALEVVAVCDMILTHPQLHHGFVAHQDIDYDLLKVNRFMKWYDNTSE